ncbi:hypothetical protein SDC9_46408 [bioreactor metagenome]|jgi:hypothetical protein|uniref:Uncharacterized protein n=1 Tax=bioreactor metagenome TaxID=1076179 RepID=A0A644W8M8_9ZZZZ
MAVVNLHKSNIFFVYPDDMLNLFALYILFVVQVVLFKAVKHLVIIIENKKKYLYLADFFCINNNTLICEAILF